jgi:hypothetical protein
VLYVRHTTPSPSIRPLKADFRAGVVWKESHTLVKGHASTHATHTKGGDRKTKGGADSGQAGGGVAGAVGAAGVGTVTLELFIATGSIDTNVQLYAMANVISRPIFVCASPADFEAHGGGIFGVQGLFCPLRRTSNKCHKTPVVLGWRDATHAALIPVVRTEEVGGESTRNLTNQAHDDAFMCAMSEAAACVRKGTKRFTAEFELHVIIVQAKKMASDSTGVICTVAAGNFGHSASYETKPAKKGTQQPEWNEGCHFTLHTEITDLTLKVKTKASSIAQCVVPIDVSLPVFQQMQAWRSWHPLVDSDIEVGTTYYSEQGFQVQLVKSVF